MRLHAVNIYTVCGERVSSSFIELPAKCLPSASFASALCIGSLPLGPRRVDSRPPIARSHAQEACETIGVRGAHRLHRVGNLRPQDGEPETAEARGRVYAVQAVTRVHHLRDGQDLPQDLRPHACTRRQRRPRLLHAQLRRNLS